MLRARKSITSRREIKARTSGRKAARRPVWPKSCWGARRMLGSLVTHSSPIPSASSLSSTVEALGALTWWNQVDHISVANVDSPVSVERAGKISIRSTRLGFRLQNQERGAVRDDGRAGNQRWRSAQREQLRGPSSAAALQDVLEPARPHQCPAHFLRLCPRTAETTGLPICLYDLQSALPKGFLHLLGVYLLVTFYIIY